MFAAFAALFDGVGGLQQLFGGLGNGKQILDLKKQLKSEIDSSRASRSRIEGLVNELGELQGGGRRGAVQGNWRILYTTEDEVNIFVKLGLVREGEGERGGRNIGEVTQTIGKDNIDNTIPFKNGGYLAVTGTCGPSETKAVRNEFQFTEAKLSLMWWRGGEVITLPPVGRGWFDTLYVDDEIRCDVNSRNDVLILARCK